MYALLIIICLPLLLIVAQISSGTTGALAYSLYKIAFLVPPILYCRYKGIHIRNDILRFGQWRNELKTALWLGVLAIAIFWGAYYFFADMLLDTSLIIRNLKSQFGVSAATVLLIAPITIFANSLLEEWFYRGFGFALLVKQNRLLAIWFPSIVYTVQHVLFFTEWLGPISFTIAVIGLQVFALVLQWQYEKAQSIVAPWVTHMFGDIAMMGIAVYMFFG